MSIDWDAIFASMRVNQVNPHARRLNRNQQYLYLAAHLSQEAIRNPQDTNGLLATDLGALITEYFGYKDRELKLFRDGLTKSGLFVTNGTRGSMCRYNVVETEELKELLERYNRFISTSAAVGPITPKPNQDAMSSDPEAQKWASAEDAAQRIVDTDPPPRSLPGGVKDNTLAILLARQYVGTPIDGAGGHTLRDDPELMRRVGEAIIELSWSK